MLARQRIIKPLQKWEQSAFRTMKDKLSSSYQAGVRRKIEDRRLRFQFQSSAINILAATCYNGSFLKYSRETAEVIGTEYILSSFSIVITLRRRHQCGSLSLLKHNKLWITSVRWIVTWKEQNIMLFPLLAVRPVKSMEKITNCSRIWRYLPHLLRHRSHKLEEVSIFLTTSEHRHRTHGPAGNIGVFSGMQLSLSSERETEFSVNEESCCEHYWNEIEGN